MSCSVSTGILSQLRNQTASVPAVCKEAVSSSTWPCQEVAQKSKRVCKILTWSFLKNAFGFSYCFCFSYHWIQLPLSVCFSLSFPPALFSSLNFPPSFSCSSTFPVPAAVTNLRITENSTRHLSFRWTASEGELSWYNIFLYNPDGNLQERAQVDPQVQSFSFQNLLQGRMYKMVIVTHSGELSNESFIFGRTGKTKTQAVMNRGGIVPVFTGFSWVGP